jgi:hypothetical protein
MTLTKQFLIESLSDTFASRCYDLIEENNIDDADSLYQEWVVNGVDPEDGEYEWCFIPNLTICE